MFGTFGALSRLGPELSLDCGRDWELTNCDVHLMCGVRDNANRLAYRTLPILAEASLQEPV
jgi:hypothetical protein